ncbi:hypothetical protein ISN45_Aa05g009020 [Arabidopsis thaliana x Arabidopsis arenosa]|uniref:Uncharacterized protein n=1 Tax=Arabidopsis thaliana x Arabidopsis arenosa TaxID=1240361 RepID=A0A8T1ZIN5_9BRAS|nr:hypothetical protein ISN45_Aa05g009020 [Arabidopsis thaliana x Arabidopsis arenosa]
MINQEAMGTTEPMNIEDSIEKQILVIHWTGWRNKPETLLSILIFIQRSPGINIQLNIDIERVNIPFLFLLFARSWMRRNSHVQFYGRDGISNLEPSTITQKEPDFVNNIEED